MLERPYHTDDVLFIIRISSGKFEEDLSFFPTSNIP